MNKYQRMVNLPKVGFWYSKDKPHLPDPRQHVGEWDEEELRLVIAHLQNPTDHIQYRGMSLCRICRKVLGSRTNTDGSYVWPEQLEHYLLEHSVKLPQEFVDHVRTSALSP